MNDIDRRLGALNVPAFDRDAVEADLLRRAADRGLIDVAYGELDSPLGRLLVAVTPRGLVRLAYPGEMPDAVLAELAARISPRILHAVERTDGVRRELDAYFDGRLHRFTTPIDWSLVSGFATGVLRATTQVPFGELTTYGRVAHEAGSSRAARAAGNALGSNPIPIVVPCHRVVHADGSIGGYTGGLDRKRFLLDLEGVAAS